MEEKDSADQGMDTNSVDTSSVDTSSVDTSSVDTNSDDEPRAKTPPWVHRIVKLMVLFAILGSILLMTGAMLINHVLRNALSGHGM